MTRARGAGAVTRRLLRLAAALPSWGRVLFDALAPRALGGAGRARIVQGVVRDERGAVLLCLRRELRGWELPGGEVAPGESDAEALRREIREETGLEVAVERLVGTWIRTGFRAHEARVFACCVAGGRLRPNPDETPSVAWFAPDALPAAIFPWFRAPLATALCSPAAPAEHHEHQGVGAIWAGARIDLASRWRGE